MFLQVLLPQLHFQGPERSQELIAFSARGLNYVRVHLQLQAAREVIRWLKMQHVSHISQTNQINSPEQADAHDYAIQKIQNKEWQRVDQKRIKMTNFNLRITCNSSHLPREPWKA
jgi:hypothetical protein